MSNILMVISGADTWIRTDGSEYPTGYWAEEVVVPHQRFTAAGHTLDIATPEGRPPTLDRHSVDPDLVEADSAKSYLDYLDSISDILDSPLHLSDVDIAGYDAVFIPGGHGPVVDLYKDRDMGRLLFAADDAGTLISAVCHGPAALLSATDADGTWLFAGRLMTAFTDDEEVALGTADKAPWLLASRLRDRGALLEGGPNFQINVARDGNLISGQNPASSGPLADAVLAAIR